MILRQLVFLLIFLFISSVHGEEKNSSKSSFKNLLEKTDLSVDFLMGGGSYQESPDDSTFVLLSVRPQAQVQFSEIFSIRSELWVNFNNARTQTRFQSPFFSTFNLMELVASIKPSSFFHLELGSINQDHLGNKMLVAYRSFPGAILYSGYESDDLIVKAKAQEAIPTSTSFETDRTEQEDLPGFQTLGMELMWKPLSWLKLDANVNTYKFRDLPSVVAFESGRLGNQVVGTNSSESFFAYDFNGLSQSYSVQIQYTSALTQVANFALLENKDAPSDRARSQWASTGLQFDLSNVSVLLSYGLFFAESDSVPALYSAFEYGRNNRDGSTYGLSLNFKELGFKVHTNYFQADLIEASLLQSNMEYVEVFLEVNVAEF